MHWTLHKHQHMLCRAGWLLKSLENLIVSRQLETCLSHLRASCLPLDDTFFPLCSVLFESVADYNLDQGDRYMKTTISKRKVMSKYLQLSNVSIISYFSSLVRFSTPITSKSIFV